MGAGLTDPFDSLLVDDCALYPPPAADDSGQVIFDPSNPGTVEAMVKARKSTLSKGREFKSGQKSSIVQDKVFMRPYANLTSGYWMKIGSDWLNVIFIDDPGRMGHHYEVYVERYSG